ncbi:MAG: hypothetical protein JWO33_1311 [Caulobacteraceae bacterium]|nr:hypothetical protein [Caulobacteraceae bacterium]
MRRFAVAALALLAATPFALPSRAQVAAPATGCEPGAKLRYICGVRNPEDLVQVPGSGWILGSGLADATKPGSGGLIVVDPQRMTATKVALQGGKAQAPFAACPGGPPEAAKFSAHGLSILPQGRGRARLFVVGHGGREAIEVFDVRTGRAEPSLTWIGCIPAPAGGQMNSVVALPDGRVLSTEFYAAPMTMGDALQGKNTGAVFSWKPGGSGFEKLAGTELPGANGIEVSPDRRYLFVAVTGTSSVMRYDLADTNKPPKVLKTEFRTDNLRWGPNGKLLLAGPRPDPACKPGPGVRCGLAPAVGALDPNTMALTMLLEARTEPAFPGLSSALVVGDRLWLGSYQADRLAYTSLAK